MTAKPKKKQRQKVLPGDLHASAEGDLLFLADQKTLASFDVWKI